MEIILIMICVFPVVAIVLFVVALAKYEKKKPIEKTKPKYLYVAKRHLMSRREEDFFKLLCDIFESKYYIIPQVHLSTLLNHKLKGQDWRGAFYHINGKSVDFVLCKRSDMSPLCAIELDDTTHDSSSRVERDVEVERIFRYANLPLVRFRNVSSLKKRDIVDKIIKAIKES